jgi:hypothetical protein
LTFTEVASAAAAQIVIGTQMAAGSNWANGGGNGVYRVPANHALGVQMTSGFVNFNISSTDPLGFRTLGINWDYDNASGLPVRQFEIRTRGTNNLTPIFHYDNNGPRQFTSYSTFASNPMNFRDDVTHVWGNPSGGDIPSSEILHVGLEQDVWDWSVVTAQTVSPTGLRSSAPVLTFHDWNNTIVEGTPAVVEEGNAASLTMDESITTAGKIRVVARGVRIVAPEDTSVVLSELALGNVEKLDLGLAGLNRGVLEQLVRREDVEYFQDFSPIMLDKGSDFLLVFEGDPADLPKEYLEQQNFIILNRADWVGQKVFLYGLGKNEAGAVGTYALVGDDPQTGKGFDLPGDTNRNLTVDLVDFDLLKRFFGSGELWSEGNFDGDLDVDLADFNIQKENFGNSAFTETVPEPATIVSALLAVAAGVAMRLGTRTSGLRSTRS